MSSSVPQNRGSALMGKPLHARGIRVSRAGLRPRAKRLLSIVTALMAVGIWFILVRTIIIGITKPHDFRFVVVWTTAIVLCLVAASLSRSAARTWRATR
jgi:hypothetical protein